MGTWFSHLLGIAFLVTGLFMMMVGFKERGPIGYSCVFAALILFVGAAFTLRVVTL